MKCICQVINLVSVSLNVLIVVWSVSFHHCKKSFIIAEI